MKTISRISQKLVRSMYSTGWTTRRAAYLAALGSLAALAPVPAFAAPSTLTDFIGLFVDLLETIIPMIASLGVLVFIWGLVKFIAKAGDSKSHEEGRNLMIWGSIGLFVMVSIWGILMFLSNEFEFSNSGIPTLPENGTIQQPNQTFNFQ